METIEIGLLLALATGIIGIATFFIGRQSSAKKDGERWGRMEANMEHLGKNIKALVDKLDAFIAEAKNTDAEITKHFKESIRRVHVRIDRHLENDHGIVGANYREDDDNG